MANRVNFQIGYSVDKNGLNEIKTSLDSISKLTSKDLMNINKSLGLTEAREQLKNLKESVNDINSALSRSFNSNLGSLNINKFNQELNSLDINRIYKDFNAAGVAGQSAFRQITTQALTTNMQLKQTHNLLDKMATTLSNSIKWEISSGIIKSFTGSIQQAYGYVKNLDRSLNDIRIVTGNSAEQMAEFAVQANKAAQSLGSGTTDFTDAALIYYQQGLDEAEARARAEVTIKAANVTQQSTSAVSEQLTAVWNGYKVSAEEAELYVDRLAAVAASTASDLEELSIGMSKVASAASAMGVSEEQLAAQIATIISVTRQAPESVGTALKTIFMRISDIEAGLDGEVSLGNYTKEMEKMGINVLNAKNELRDMGEVIEEVGGKWANMSREQQIALSQTMAGTRQANNLIALFDNWDQYTDTLEVASNATGDLQKQQDIYMEGTQAHLKVLSASFEDFADSMLNSDVINTFASGLSNSLNMMTNFVDAIGGGGNTLLTLGSIATTVFSKQIAQGLSTTITNFQNAQYNAQKLASEIEALGKIQSSKAMQDPGIAALINAKEQLQQYYSLLSPQQTNEGNGLIQELARAKDLQLQWEANINAAVKYSQALMQASESGETIKSLKDLDFRQGSVTAEEMQLHLAAAAEDVQRLEASVKDYNAALQAYNPNTIEHDWDSVWSSLERCVEAAEELSGRTDLSKGSVEKLNIALSSLNMNDAFDYISSDFDNTTANAEKTRMAISRLKNAVAEATGEISANVQNTNNVLNREFGQSVSRGKELKQATDEAKESLDRFNSSAEQTAKIQGFVRVTSAVSQCVSAVNSLVNVYKIWNNEDLSTGEKTLQIVMAISMALPMLVSGLHTLATQGPIVIASLLGVEAASLSVTTVATAMWTAITGPIGIAIAAIAGLGVAVYSLTSAYNADADAAEKAAEQAENLANQYDKLNSKYKEFSETTSAYNEAVDGLSELKKGTEEYAQAIETANEKALELLETNTDLQASAYRNADGIIAFKNNALEAYDNLQKTYLANAQEASLIAEQQANLATMQSNLTNVSRNIDGYSLDENGLMSDFNENVLSKLAEIYEENGNIIDEDVNKLDNVSEEMKQSILDHRSEVVNLITSNNDLVKANEFLASELANSYLQKNEKFSDMDASMQSAITSILSNYQSGDAYQEAYDQAIRDYNAMSDQALHDAYAAMMNYATAGNGAFFNGWGKGTFVDQEGNEIKIDDSVMREVLAQEQATEAALGENTETLREATSNVESLKNIGDDIGQKLGLEGIGDELLGFINKNDTQFDNISELKPDQVEQLKQAFNNAVFDGIDFELLGYKSEEEFEKALEDAFDAYDPSVFADKLKEAISSAESDIRSVMEGVQSGDLSYKNIGEDEGYQNLIEQLEELKDEYPELEAAAQILSETWEVGTQKYAEALEVVQDRLYELNLDNLIDSAKEASDAVEEFFEMGEDGSVEIDIEANGEEFEQAVNDYLNSQYEIDIAVHTEAEQEFNSIMNAMDDIYDKANMIGESFIVAADDVRELNNTFPGILEGMQALSDGTIQLNEDIVRSAMASAEAEVQADAQAATQKLESQATLLRAKQASYQTMAEAARVLAGEEVDSEMSADEAKAAISAELENLKQTNSEIAANTQMTHNEQVATSSDENARITADNWNSAANSSAKSIAAFANSAIQNMQAVAASVKAAMEGEAVGGNVSAGSVSTSYSGATGKSSEAAIIQETENALKNAKSASQDTWSKLAGQYQSLADSAGAAANDVEGMIAQIGAKGVELDNALGNVSKGYGTKNPKASKGKKGGSGKKKKGKEKKADEPDVEEYLDEEIDRYHDINVELEKREKRLSRLEKLEDRYYGKKLINHLNKELNLLEKQNKAYEKKMKLLKQERSELRESLGKQGVKFNDNGDIKNYEKAIKKRQGIYNSYVKKYNSMSKEQQEKYKDTLDKQKQAYEDFIDDLERYDEIHVNEINELKEEIQDNLYEMTEIKIKKFTMSVEIRLEMGEAARDWNEFKSKVINGLKDDDIIGNAKKELKDWKTYFNSGGYGKGSIQALTTQLNRTVDDIKRINKTGEGLFYGNDKQSAIEDLEKYLSTLEEQMIEMEELAQSIRDAYLDVIDEATEAFDKQVDQYENINNILNHDMNVVGLLYGDDAYMEMDTYYKKIEQNNNQELDFLKKRVAYAQEMMDAETDPKAKEKWQEEWNNALSELNDKVEDSIQNLIDKYVNMIDYTIDKLNKKITGGFDLDYISDEWDLINKNADVYYDNVNALYEMQKLENKFMDAIENSDEVSTQDRLTKVMNEQLGYLREKEKITEYDIKRANMMYDITLKQIALEEAQQNKNQLRLRRDSQGNYTYQYVADDNDVDKTKEELNNLQQDLYNLDKEGYIKNLNDIYAAYNEFQQKIKELYEDQTLSAEERSQKEAMYVEQYGELINSYVRENTYLRTNLEESAFDALQNMYDYDKTNFEAITGIKMDEHGNMTKTMIDEFGNMVTVNIGQFGKLSDDVTNMLMTELVPQWSSNVQKMRDNIAAEGGLVPACQDAFLELQKTTMEYQGSLGDLEEAAGVNFEEIAKGIDKNIEKSKELLADNDELIETYRNEVEQIKAVIAELDRLIAKFQEARDAAIEAAKEAYKLLQTEQKKTANAAEKDTKKQLKDDKDKNNKPKSVTVDLSKDKDKNKKKDTGGDSKKKTGSVKVSDVKKGDVLTYIGGTYYYDSYGTSPSGNRGPGKKVEVENTNPSAPYPIAVKSNDSAYGWLKESQLSYKTGGYTGDWANGDEDGKLAFVHKKELILNKHDTENMLSAVNLVRDMEGLFNNVNESIMSRLLGLSSIKVPTGITKDSDKIEQDVRITANFPNATNKDEIEQAFKNLVNIASQRAYNNQR